MTLDQVTEAHARRQKLLAQRTSSQLAKLWRRLDPGNLVASWRLLLPAAVAALSTSQATAAASAGIYVEDCLEAQNLFLDAEARVAASAFAGVASDGRDLEGLLFRPVVTTLLGIKAGDTLDRSRAAGQLALDVISRTQVADAGRAAEAVAIASRPQVQGYVRMLSMPSCSRCVILAGRFYRWSAGFRRHPRCDCRHIPSQENRAGDLTTNPKKAFESLSAAEQDRLFGKAGAEAVRNGADLSQVVNARRGMSEATIYGQKVLITREGTTKRGMARRRLGKRPVRLMPEQIFKEANGNRAEAIRLLKFHGYII